MVLFLTFGTISIYLISSKLGGFSGLMERIKENPQISHLLARDRMSQTEFFSYMFIPLSAIMFPHIAIMCMTAERITHFKKTVIFYPLCIAAIWVPCVYLGVLSADLIPGLQRGEANDVIPQLLSNYTEVWVAGILGAGIMACVMATDSQIMAMTTMFTQDIYHHYVKNPGLDRAAAEKREVWMGRAFVICIALVSYLIALAVHKQAGIFELAIRFAFSGFAALAPVMLAALFWKRSTATAAWCAVSWVGITMLGSWWLHNYSNEMAAALKPGQQYAQIFPALGDLFLRGRGSVTMFGFLLVMPMTIGTAVIMIVVSLFTKTPSQPTLDKYFPPKTGAVTP